MRSEREAFLLGLEYLRSGCQPKGCQAVSDFAVLAYAFADHVKRARKSECGYSAENKR